MRVLRATGLESEREIPFGDAAAAAASRRSGVLDGIPPAQADALAAALELPRGDARQPIARDRFTIGAAVLSLLCRYAENGPIAVVVDDLHLADDAFGECSGVRRAPTCRRPA